MRPKTALAWREISGYIDQALELEGTAREAWIRDLGQRAPDIAAQISDYLAKVAELDRRNFLQDAAITDPLSATLAGQQLGRYTLDRPIGHGGMGTVWLCHRSDGHYEGRAAVKLLNTALVGHPSAGRFAREGSVLARLQHPNIAHLLDAGIASSGQPYLVLEYVEGERIDLYCDHKALDFKQRIELFLAVLDAVAHAHSNLIVHRDLKPSNILVTHHGVVKLLDFGVAALLYNDAETLAVNRVTAFGAPGLTPGYAAPEQLCEGPITTATDVYALGVLLFVLLAGRHPLSTEEASLSELMRLTLETEMPRPSAVALDLQHRRLLAGDLDNIIAMALRPNPAERYTTVELFAQDLRRYLALEPVSARAQSVPYRAAKFVRRHRAGVAAAVLLVATLLAGIVATTMQMLEARRQRDEVRYQSQRADSTIEFLWALMASDGGPDRPTLTVEQRVRRGMEMLEQTAATDPSFAGRMMIQLPRREIEEANPDFAIELYERAFKLGERAEDARLMATAHCSIVAVLENTGRTEDSARRLAEAKITMGREYVESGVDTGCLLAEAKVENRLGNKERAAELLRGVVSVIEAGRDSCGSCYPSVLSSLGRIYMDQGKIIEAIAVALKVGPAYEESGFGDTLTSLTARQNVATLLSMAGEVRLALAERERINTQLPKFMAAGQDSFGYVSNHAIALLRLARPAQARQILGDAVARARTAGNPRMYLALLSSQAWAAMLEAEWSVAQALLDEAQPVADGNAGSATLRGRIEMLRAQIERANGRLQPAREHIDKALSILKYGTEQPEPVLPQMLTVASRIALQQGLTSDAEKFANDALSLSERVARGPASSGDVGEALLRLAQARATSATGVDVQPLLERAVQCLTNGFGADHPLTIEARELLASRGSKSR